ncbi:MAG TPA: hypothetical protein VIR29_09955 [Anseongella sp.]
MFSTAFLLIFMGFYLQYNLSGKVKSRHKSSYLVYMEQHALLSRALGVAAAVAGLIIMVARLGVGSGLFGFVVVLMSVGCLIVALAPFRFLRWRHLAGLYLGSVCFEVLIF